MSETPTESNHADNPLSEEDKELEAFGKALKRLDSNWAPSPDSRKRFMEEVRRHWPESHSAVERLQSTRQSHNMEREGRD